MQNATVLIHLKTCFHFIQRGPRWICVQLY